MSNPTSMLNDRGHLSSDLLNALEMGLLSDQSREEAQGHLKECSLCLSLYQEIQNHHQEFKERVLPRTLPRVVHTATAKKSWLKWLIDWRIVAPAAASAALVVMIVLWVPWGKPQQTEVRIKGDPVFKIYAQRKQNVFTVRPGAQLKAGDRIRFEVDPGRSMYLLIISKDGSGNVSLYHPVGKTHSQSIQPGRSQLPGSIELDDAPGPERILAIFSEVSLEIQPILDSLRRVKGNTLTLEQIPKAKYIASLVFEKEP